MTYAGWSTRQENLERNVIEDDRLDATFHRVTGWCEGGLIERTPLPATVRGRARALVQARHLAAQPRPEVIWTSGRELVLPYLWSMIGPRRPRLVVELDWTLAQQEAMAPWYYDRPSRSGPQQRLALARQAATFRYVDLFVAMSRWAADSLVEAGVDESQISVLHPGLDLNVWSAVPKERRDRSPLHVLFVGGDFVRKGGDLLVEAVSGPFAGRVVADIVTRDDVSARAGIRVHRCEPNSPELRALYRSAEIFVMPTRADCFGHVIVEAMASGLPVIASKVAGIPELVEQGKTGWTVEPSSEGLNRALEEALSAKDRLPQMGLAARAVAERRFDGRRNDGLLVDAMLELIEGRRSMRR